MLNCNIFQQYIELNQMCGQTLVGAAMMIQGPTMTDAIVMTPMPAKIFDIVQAACALFSSL
jgi:hypothetical protein